jgi:hypothetical protein
MVTAMLDPRTDVFLHPYIAAQSEPLGCSSCTRPLRNHEVNPHPEPHEECGLIVSVDVRFLCANCWATIRKAVR